MTRGACVFWCACGGAGEDLREVRARVDGGERQVMAGDGAVCQCIKSMRLCANRCRMNGSCWAKRRRVHALGVRWGMLLAKYLVNGLVDLPAHLQGSRASVRSGQFCTQARFSGMQRAGGVGGLRPATYRDGALEASGATGAAGPSHPSGAISGRFFQNRLGMKWRRSSGLARSSTATLS